jgi:hypothetical protein
VYAVTEGHDRGWADLEVLIGLALASVGGYVTWVRASVHQRPALDISLWRNRTFTIANLLSVCYGAALYPILLLGVLFMVRMWGYSELGAGLAMTPPALATVVVALGIGRLPHVPSAAGLVFTGLTALTVANAGLALGLGAHPHFVTVWLPLGLLAGVGTGLTTVGISTSATLSIAPQHFASATGLVMAGRQVGGAVGIACLAALLDRASGDPITVYTNAYWVMAGIPLLGVGLAWLTRFHRLLAPSPTGMPAAMQAGAPK